MEDISMEVKLIGGMVAGRAFRVWMFSVLLGFFSCGVHAEVIFQESFEIDQGNWYADNGVWQIGTPTAGPSACYGGTQCAGTVLDGNYPGDTDSRLVGPAIQLPPVVNGEEIQLRFWQWFSYVSNGTACDAGHVQISVQDKTTGVWSDWATVGNPITNTSTTPWSRMGADVTAYAGAKVRLGFFHVATSDYSYPYYCGGSSFGWYIDDVQIVKSVPVFTGDFETGWNDWFADRGVWEIGTPTAGPSACYGGTQCAGTILNGNYPDDTDSRLISASIQLPPVVSGEEIQLRFWQWFSYVSNGTACDAGYVQISVQDKTTGVWSDWTNVGNPIINTSSWSRMSVDLTAYAGAKARLAFYHTATSDSSYPYYCGGSSSGWYVDNVQIVKNFPAFTRTFESGWGDWSADRGVWQIGTPTAGPSACYGGSQCAGTVLDGNYPGDTDSRLISASIHLPQITNGEELQLRFRQWFAYVSNGTACDAGYVQISVHDQTTGAWSAWTSVSNAIINTSPWSPIAVPLTAYAGAKARLAFFHTATSDYSYPYYCGGSSFGWYIDNVELVVPGRDSDGDGVTDNLDNCINVANPDQRDTDGDGYGNMCDGDLNNDGDTNTLDLNIYKLAHRSKIGDPNFNPNADFNGDGAVNTLDLNIYKSLHRKPPGPSGLVP